MGKKLTLTESELHKVIRRIIEQTEDEYYRISPEDYLDMMKYASNNGNVFRRMKEYGGKPLYITGDLDLSGKDVTDIGPIAYVDGSLDIRNSNIAKLGDLKVKSWISDSNTPRERIREKEELNAKRTIQESLRENDEWALEQGDETGEKAHALFNSLRNTGEIETLSDEDKEKLVILQRKLQDLEEEYDNLDDDDDRLYELQDAIDELDVEIEELEENNLDVYMMFPTQYSFYGLQQFEVLIPGFKNNEYAVGTEEEMDAAALRYAKDYIDDVGAEGFNESFVEDYLDVDAIVNMAEEDYDYQIRDYPERYFSDSDYELTDEQEERKDELETMIYDLEQQRLELDSDDENYYDYDEDLENQIEALQEELDSIEVDTEPTEEMIENKVYELVRDVRRDPLDYLKNYGLNIKDYIDEDELAKGLVDTDGWGVMNSYDGQYDNEDVNGVEYYIMRVN